MGEQEPQNVNFLGMNIVILSIFGIIVFGYVLFLIRRRWTSGFLHRDKKKQQS